MAKARASDLQTADSEQLGGTDGASDPIVTVVVPVFNSLDSLPECVSSIQEAIDFFGPAELILVDNGSTDGSLEFLKTITASYAKVLVRADQNVGGVRNWGAAHGRGTFLAFVDSDCTIPSNYIHQALEVLSCFRADATGSVYELPEHPGWVERVWFRMHTPRGDGWVKYLNAGNFFCTKSAFDAVSGFDPALVSGEDAELGQRLRTSGFRIYGSASVRAIHLGNPKTLSGFFRKQVWHGMGALGTFRHEWLDRVLIMTVAHGVISLLALLAVLASPSLRTGLLAIAMAFSVPTISAAYRVSIAGRFVNPLLAIIMYWVYFGARGVALLRLLTSDAGRRRR